MLYTRDAESEDLVMEEILNLLQQEDTKENNEADPQWRKSREYEGRAYALISANENMNFSENNQRTAIENACTKNDHDKGCSAGDHATEGGSRRNDAWRPLVMTGDISGNCATLANNQDLFDKNPQQHDAKQVAAAHSDAWTATTMPLPRLQELPRLSNHAPIRVMSDKEFDIFKRTLRAQETYRRYRRRRKEEMQKRNEELVRRQQELERLRAIHAAYTVDDNDSLASMEQDLIFSEKEFRQYMEMLDNCLRLEVALTHLVPYFID